jgi:hypothetical protein
MTANQIKTDKWLDVITRIKREVFNLSQKSGMPKSARMDLDYAREYLRSAKVNIQFDTVSPG